ncbi:hypothetical protein BN2476_510053 [Paraburkholderia piptadeniae]|uniref:Uncharacterized protein n=1 Tax=Paraburkholderia piptadeniae TaxID=1701573 RepID=A0A1N7SGV2_9BURK|nr:hypothetical protein BN2476_510053 [Paraburkholderia piptadeniae]
MSIVLGHSRCRGKPSPVSSDYFDGRAARSKGTTPALVLSLFPKLLYGLSHRQQSV